MNQTVIFKANTTLVREIDELLDVTIAENL